MPTVSSSSVRLAAGFVAACCLVIGALAQTVTDTPVHDTAAGGPFNVTSSNPASALAHEDLDATLWMQTSSEYRSACLQIFRAAKRQLGSALLQRNTTAALEQQAALHDPQGHVAQLPPAVILDVDETVLDNSAFQAHLIETGGQYDPGEWDQWISTHTSPPIPGVTEFIDACRSAGVTVFFVTNRRTETRDATLANLKKLDLIRDGDAETLLCKNDRPTWTSDKTTRRASIAECHRILLILGDDLNDFLSVGIRPSSEARRALAEEQAAMWGEKWFILPNPTYGGWERSIHNWQDGSPRETKLRFKRDALISE